jgi:hypothetical protein
LQQGQGQGGRDSVRPTPKPTASTP